MVTGSSTISKDRIEQNTLPKQAHKKKDTIAYEKWTKALSRYKGIRTIPSTKLPSEPKGKKKEVRRFAPRPVETRHKACLFLHFSVCKFADLSAEDFLDISEIQTSFQKVLLNDHSLEARVSSTPKAKPEDNYPSGV